MSHGWTFRLFPTFHSHNLFDPLNSSFLPNFPFCSLPWKASSEREGRERKEGPPWASEKLPQGAEAGAWGGSAWWGAAPGTRWRQRPEARLVSDALLQVRGFQSLNDLEAWVQPDPSSSLTITHTSKLCAMWSWTVRGSNEMLPWGPRDQALRTRPCRHLQKPAEGHRGLRNIFRLCSLPSHHQPWAKLSELTAPTLGLAQRSPEWAREAAQEISTRRWRWNFLGSPCWVTWGDP